MCTVHVLHARRGNRKQRQGEENYLEWRRCRSRCWWLTVALVSWQPAVLVDVGSPSSFLCFTVLSSSSVFFLYRQCSCLNFNGFNVLAGLLVAAKRNTGGRTRRTLLRFLYTFFFLLLSNGCVSAGWFLETEDDDNSSLGFLRSFCSFGLSLCVSSFASFSFLYFLVSGSTSQGTVAMDANCWWGSLASVPLFLCYCLPMLPSSPPSPSVSFYSTYYHLFFSLVPLSVFLFFFLPPLSSPPLSRLSSPLFLYYVRLSSGFYS